MGQKDVFIEGEYYSVDEIRESLTDETAAKRFSEAEAKIVIDKVLPLLGEEEKICIKKYFFEEKDIHWIASELNITFIKVYIVIQQALRRLREHLEKE